MARLPRPVITRMSVSPAATASSTTYWIEGLSTTGSISFGWLFVAGRNRVPSPAAGMTAFLIARAAFRRSSSVRRYPSARGALVADVGRIIGLLRGRVEPELPALHEATQVGQVAPDDEQRHHRDDRDVTRLVPRQRDRDRERDRHRHRRDRRLVREAGEHDPQRR